MEQDVQPKGHLQLVLVTKSLPTEPILEMYFMAKQEGNLYLLIPT